MPMPFPTEIENGTIFQTNRDGTVCAMLVVRYALARFFCLYNEILIRNSRGVRAHAAVSVSFLSVLLIFYLYNLNQQSISRELNLEIMSN